MWNATGSADENGIVREFSAVPAYDDADPHVRESMDVAKHAVSVIIGTGALGGPGESYELVFRGHANEGHRPGEDGELDELTVSIRQLAREEGPSTETNPDAA